MGTSTLSNGRQHAVAWEKGSFIAIGDSDALSSTAFGINPSGQVVGTTQASGQNPPAPHQAVLWHDEVTSILPMIGGDSAEARAINATGQIVGAGETATGETHAVLWTRK